MNDRCKTETDSVRTNSNEFYDAKKMETEIPGSGRETTQRSAWYLSSVPPPAVHRSGSIAMIISPAAVRHLEAVIPDPFVLQKNYLQTAPLKAAQSERSPCCVGVVLSSPTAFTGRQ